MSETVLLTEHLWEKTCDLQQAAVGQCKKKIKKIKK